MPAITPPDQSEIDAMEVVELGARDGSSPVESFEINGSTAERTFRVNWASRNAFVWWMLGYAETWDDAGTTRLSRLLPQAHPLYPDLVATKCTRIKGFKWNGNEVADVGGVYQFPVDGSQISTFAKADVTIRYDHVTYERVEDADIYATLTEFDRFVVRGEVTPGADYLQLPGAAFKYYRSSGTTAPDGFAVPFNSGRIIPTERFVLTWHRLPENVWTPDSGLSAFVYGTGAYSSGAALGSVNKTTFYDRPPGTVLLESVRPILLRDPFGTGVEWDIEYTFAYSPKGWNFLYFYDYSGTNSGWYHVSSSGDYEAPGSVTDNRSIYNERELNNLFSVDN
jgi:hypothetical protein